MVDQFHHDDTLFHHILFSDEDQFKLNGLVNGHNRIYYDTINHHVLYKTQLNQPGILFCDGVSPFGIFGPALPDFFFFENLYSLNFFQHCVWIYTDFFRVDIRP